MSNKLKRMMSMLLVIMLVVTSAGIPVYAVPAVADHVIISQIYGGGGNSGAVYSHDFIELYNPTSEVVNLEGWSVQYGSTKGIFDESKTAVLSGSIDPGSYYLIQCNPGSNLTLPGLPTPDDEAGLYLGGSSGTVALSNGGTPITGVDDASIVDFVGYGDATAFEGSGATPKLSNSTAAVRATVGVDTDDNAADFVVAEPNPRNSGNMTPKVTITPSTDQTDAISGATLQLTVNAENATIYHTFEPVEATTSAIIAVEGVNITTASVVDIKIIGEIGDKVTLTAFAMADGYETSDVFVQEYTIKDPNKIYTIPEVLALTDGTQNVTVRGVLSYFATSYGNPIIQAEIDGEVSALYVYGSAPEGAVIGDEIQLTGTYKLYNGLPELTSVTASEIIQKVTPIPAAEMTVEQILANGLNMLGRVVKIKNATLGAYNSGGNTPITDVTGTINIYKGTPYPILVEEGDVVDVYAMIATYKTSLQLYTGTFEDNGFNVYDVVNDTKAPVITLNDYYAPAKPNIDYTFGVKVQDNKAVDTVKLSYTIGDVVKSDLDMVYNPTTLMYEFTIPGAEIPMTVDELTASVVATDVTGLSTESEDVVVTIDNKPQFLSFNPARNSSTDENKSPLISVTLVNEGEAPEVLLTLVQGETVLLENVIMTPNSEDAHTFEYQTGTLEDGLHTATVVVTRADSGTATETWNFTVGTPEFRPFFGQLHAHTAQYSDGTGTLADALSYLKGLNATANVNFISVTDHSNYFDSTSAANPAEALNDKTQMTAASLEKWNSYTGAMDAFNAENDGSKIALPGFEMTWSGGPGHINTFNSDGLISRNNSSLNNKSNDAGMKSYYDTLIQNTDPLANLSQFNHPGSTFGTFSDFAYWSPSYDNKMVAVEVGNGEGAIGSGGYFPSFAEYTKALDKGWHVAPTNNQDNHKGYWGNANTARTVVITDQLTETGLLTGLKNMSVYATEDHNLNIGYTVNGEMMGSIIETVPETPLQFAVNVDDADSGDIISKVEIITNSGRIAASKTFDSTLVDWTFELAPEQGYYYVRVTQADKNIAVTAPVWVGQAPLVGISSVATTTKMPVTGEELTFTTTLFNNEATPVTVTSLKFETEDQVLDVNAMAEVIESAGTFAYDYSFTPSTPGLEKITVTAAVSVGGQEKLFTQSIDLNVRDSEKLVYIGIDASHYNEYVRGNYKDSMGNFASMAVDFDVRVVELETSEDLIAATQNDKFEMLIFTPPTRRDGRDFLIGYKNYTEAEVAAVKAFAESGKSVIVTGWSDYYENYDSYTDGTPYTLPATDQMAAQQNRLLEAIGSSLRISDDQIMDYDNNGGQPQRLYLEAYNLDNPFLKGVVVGEQVYSNYGGASVYAVDGENAPTGTLPEHVSPMVSGFETTQSLDGDGDGVTNTEGVEVPKYNNKVLSAASEQVSYDNGKTAVVIAAGSAFMSNFEIQVQLDSYATPAYSNYTILENVVQSVNPIVVTDISEVHAAEEGVKFTIEGIATSNASGYDRDTAFFDTIYVQDETAGINVFPVAGDFRAGQTVQITGTTSSYNGERQLNVQKITIIDESIKPLPAPRPVSASEINNATYLGSLVQLSGRVSQISYANDVPESIFVIDAAGQTARVFIDGYITQDKEIPNLEVGSDILAIGLSSIDTEGARIRIRDRADVICQIPVPGEEKPAPTPTEAPEIEAPVAVVVIGEETTPEELAEAIENAIQNAGENAPELTLMLGADAESLELSPETLEQLVEGNVGVTISKDGATYSLPADEIDLEAFASLLEDGSLAGDIELKISVQKVDAETESMIQEWADANGFELVGTPVAFEVTVVSKSTGNSVGLTEFGGYVERIIEIGYVDAEDGFAGVYVDADGNMAPVPTTFFVKGGKLYARIKSMTNSTYAVVSTKNVVKGVEGHWSAEVVQKMANRLVLTDVENFAPDQKITRAEFTDYVVRALGLYRVNQFTEGRFTDVSASSKYANSIAIANKWGIVNGYLDGSFKPDNTISRQEAMVMYANALRYLEIEASHSNRLNQYADKNLVANWALDSVNMVLDREIFNGVSNSALSPLGTFTHAEALQALYNFMNRF